MNNINYHISNLIECWLHRNFRQMKFLKQESKNKLATEAIKRKIGYT